MSKPTVNFWSGFGWCLIWLGFFGGIALVIWAENHFSNSEKRQCISEHGQWTRINEGSGWSSSSYYTCEFKEKPNVK